MRTAAEDLWNRLDECLLLDRRMVRRALSAARALERAGKPADRLLEQARERLERSILTRRRRLALRPPPAFDLDLPILAKREEIARTIAANQVVVLCGETGSGKTTQLPKICLDIGRGIDGLIGHTQPRRIAARTVAARIADELSTPLGRAVGYKIRFGDRTSPDTYIKLMTDGILLAETQTDRLLERYDTLIIDEAHERSLNIDFLLGYLRQLLPRRPDLKIVITSATIDPQRFAAHFSSAGGEPAPIVEVSGRTYPVDVLYRPIETDDPDDAESDREAAILAAVDELARLDGPRHGPGGDILIFLAGERDIRQTAEALRKHHPAQAEVLPLYARLSVAEQQRVFQPHKGRRIVLATNVAETSLTVPGIKYVVDPGLARISRYSPRRKVQSLPIEAISQASADQRKGRCGRVSDGVCVRLYCEEDFNSRPRFTEPEILRTNLASVILQMKSLGLGEIEAFPFVEPPDGRMIRDGYDTLQELGAIDAADELLPLGRKLAKLPIDPRLGRMLLAASDGGALAEVLVIAAALSIQDPRERPAALQDKADAAHARFQHETSDFLSLWNLWTEYQRQAGHLSSSKLRKWCHDGFLSFLRMREWADVHQQLHAQLADMGFHPNERPAEADAVHRAVLAGLLSNVGMKGDGFEYRGTRSSKFGIFPGSGLFKKAPKWVMAAEVVQTTRLYARTVAKIDAAWIEAVGAHVVKRAHSDAHWSKETGEVVAFERGSVFGLELYARRRVGYANVDPKQCRDIFIHHALVLGEWRLDPPFFRHNREMLDRARELEAKARTHDIAADQAAVHEFYAARVPAGVCTVAAFEKWRRQAERADPRALMMSESDAVRRPPSEITPQRYPDEIPVAGSRLKLEYVFDPGGAKDGVTVSVPIEALVQFTDEQAEWLVPGRLDEKVLALLKCLPKAQRKVLEPVPELARECAERLRGSEGRGRLTDRLADLIFEIRGVRVPPEAWQPKAVADHLRLNVRLGDERNAVLAESRDLADLRARFGARAQAAFSKLARGSFDRAGLTDWTFGELPARLEIERNGFRVAGFPAIVDEGSSAALRLLGSESAAAAATAMGLRRLFALRARDELTYHLRLVRDFSTHALRFAPIGSPEELRRDLTDLAADRAFVAGLAPVRTRAEFEARLAEGWKRIGPAMREIAALVGNILGVRHAAAVRIEARQPPAWESAVADMAEQLAHLCPAGFLRTTPFENLRHMPRYLSAIQTRLDRLKNAGLARDQRGLGEVRPRWARYTERGPDPGAPIRESPALREYRWMIEELRVSLFAQELGTAVSVSPKKLDEQWARVLSWRPEAGGTRRE